MKTSLRSTSDSLTRGEKILVFMCEFGKRGRAKIRYEDIVVGVFKKYPCRALISDNLEGYSGGTYTAEEALFSIDRNCGPLGYIWNQR